MARVSVVIPSRDRAGHLGDAIDSVLAQGWPDLEVVVVDDGSTDGTAEVLSRRYGGAVTVVSLQPGRGRSAARNAGVAASTGELVAFLDSDDLWLPGKLARQVPRFDDPDVDLVHGWIEPIDEAGLVLEEHALELDDAFRRAMERGYDYAGATETWCFLWTSAVVVRRAAFDAAGGFDPAFDHFEDWDLWWRIALAGRVATVPERVAAYRVHDRNSGHDLAEHATTWLRVNEKHLDLLARHPDVPDRRMAERNLAINHALGEHWRGDGARSRRWMRRALRLDPSLLLRPAHPVWHGPLLSTLAGPAAGRAYALLWDRDVDRPRSRPLGEEALDAGAAVVPADAPTLTIVVISYERRRALLRLLDSLRPALEGTARSRGVDLVVLLDGSTDGSLEAVEALHLPVPHRVVWQENAGRAAARNAGLAAAAGDLVLFLDDDGLATPGLVAAHRAAHGDGRVPQVVIGPCQIPDGTANLPVLVDHSRRHHARLARYGRALEAYQVTFANTSAPRQLLVELGGFDAEFAGWGAEDGELGARLLRAGVAVTYHPGAVVWHDHQGTREDFVRTRRELGRNTARLLERHPELVDAYLAPTSGASRWLLRRCPRRAGAYAALAGPLLGAGLRLHRAAPRAGLGLMWMSADALQAAGLLDADPSGTWVRTFTAATRRGGGIPRVLLPGGARG